MGLLGVFDFDEGSLKICFQEVKIMTLWFKNRMKWKSVKCRVKEWALEVEMEATVIEFILPHINYKDFLNKTFDWEINQSSFERPL